MNTDEWPDCPVEGCPNKICLSLNSEFCFPHTPGNKHVKGMKIDARNGNTDLVEDDDGGRVKSLGLNDAEFGMKP